MQSIGTPFLWIGFIVFVLAMLALDLGVFHRKAHSVHYKEALTWSVVWITLALLFGVLIGFVFGKDYAVTYVTGYLIEKALSVDNLFVILMVFTAFKIPLQYQHRVLFWGILTALFLRAAMILGGTALLQRFHWLLYVFGAFLIFTGFKLFFANEEEDEHPEQKPLQRFIRKLIPSTSQLHGSRFFVRERGKFLATPLFIVLILVEISDVVFALDSIPAIFAITLDPFIVFTSNIFAILGLRSLFFLVANLVDKFVYLKTGLALVLTFIGTKMLADKFVHVTPMVSLTVVLGVLFLSVVASLLKTNKR